jgi:hypothetical protein
MVKANNGYAHGKAQSSDTGTKFPDGQKPDLKNHKVKTSHDERDDSPKYKPDPNQKHEGFQFGGNPEKEGRFERRLVEQEKRERELARERYCEGIQGRDGGKKPYECYNPNN